MRLARLNPGFVTLDPVMQISKAIHDGKTLFLVALTGHTITLPPALGSGCRLRFVSKIAATSNNNIIKVQNSIDVMLGSAQISITAGGALSCFQAAPTTAGADTVTLNRTTTGGAIAGEILEFQDIAPGFWVVDAMLNGTATPATPFSATV